MSSNTVQKACDYDLRIELLVHGYIHENGMKDAIPNELAAIMIIFYGHADQWNKNKKGKDIEINGQSIKYNKDYIWSCVYGETACETPYRYDWALKIQNIP